MTLVDKDGVPRLVQRIKYRYSDMAFEVTLFDGRIAVMGAEDLSPTVGLLTFHPNHEQMQDAWIAAERIFDDLRYARAVPNLYL